MRPGVGDEHRLVQRLANNLWFRQTDYVRYERQDLVRRSALSTEEDSWSYLSPRLCALGQDAFDGAPAVVREIHQYLKKILNAKERVGATMLQLMQQISIMSLDLFDKMSEFDMGALEGGGLKNRCEWRCQKKNGNGSMRTCWLRRPNMKGPMRSSREWAWVGHRHLSAAATLGQ